MILRHKVHLEPRLTMFNGKLVVMQLISHNATLAAIWKSVLREDNTLSYCECRIISYCDTLRRRYVWVCKWHISACSTLSFLYPIIFLFLLLFSILILSFHISLSLSFFLFLSSFNHPEWKWTNGMRRLLKLVQTIIKSLNNCQI